MKPFRDIIARLKRASFREIRHRANRYLFVRRLKKGIQHDNRPYKIPKIGTDVLNGLILPDIAGHTSEDTVEALLDGKRFCLNFDSSDIRSFEKKYRHRLFPDIRLSDQNPDIRAVWEPARLQHLSILLKHGRLHPDPDRKQVVLNTVRKELLEWCTVNPFPKGPNYMSPMECGLRIPALVYCLKYNTLFSGENRRAIIGLIFEHAWLIENRLSLYSSRGNHTISEAIGLIFAGGVYRYVDIGKRWLDTGVRLLENELSHQMHKDGGPAEQSLSYHRFVLDLYWLAMDFLETNRVYDCGSWNVRLMAGEAFSHTLSDGLEEFRVGDSDDGHAIAPGLFPKSRPPVKAPTGIFTFLDTGYTIIRNEIVFLVFDHAPLGMPPLYNHGHADALSVMLAIHGRQLLIDPGTYRYNGTPGFRRYFKGTRAHNTVLVDGRDQAVQETGFVWSKPYACDLQNHVHDGNDVSITASHNGYARFQNPVLHRRTVEYRYPSVIVITDRFSGTGVHRFELNYHLHPDVVPVRKGDWWRLCRNDAEAYIKLAGHRLNLVKGQKQPLMGWFSPGYNLLLPTNVLTHERQGPPNAIAFKTVIFTDAR